MKSALEKMLDSGCLTFEKFNGLMLYLPWGAGFIYCGMYDQPLGYRYGMVSLGIVLMVWGLRKATVNRVKQQAKFMRRVNRISREI